jgi:pyruvate/2-oxoglutarate dehydrogenase complex dihydrolipoamide dehydrogenase (E3) component
LPGSVFIVGAGSSGNACARTLSTAGWQVTIAERDHVGGACLWRACVPKKALYTTSRLVREVERGEDRGVLRGDQHVDWQGALAWKWHSQETYAGDQEGALVARGIRVLKANDTNFVSPHEIESAGELFRPDHIVIATGSEPVIPQIPGIELADTSDDALRYHTLPRSLLVVGGGFVGVELGTLFASLGTEVTFVTRAPRLLDMLDAEIAAVTIARLEKMGAVVRTSSTLASLEPLVAPGAPESTGHRTVRAHVLSDAGEDSSADFERVLMAVGRMPALDGLDLAAAAIDVDGRGRLILDEHLRTTNPRVWAVGDAAGGMMQTPVANMEGHTVAASILSGQPRVVDTTMAPMTAFTTPQLAQVGLTEQAAEKAGTSVTVTRQPFEYLAAAIIEEERDGLVKLVFDERSGRLIGGAIAAPAASDLIYSVVVAMAGGLTQEQIASTVAIHPAFCEGVAWAAG